MSNTQHGPSLRITLHCAGCSALSTKDWEDYLEDDEVDRGTTATCTVEDKKISEYWYSHDQIPDWCPRKPDVPIAVSAVTKKPTP